MTFRDNDWANEVISTLRGGYILGRKRTHGESPEVSWAGQIKLGEGCAVFCSEWTLRVPMGKRHVLGVLGKEPGGVAQRVAANGVLGRMECSRTSSGDNYSLGLLVSPSPPPQHTCPFP